MRLTAAGSSVIGPAHLQDNTPNQDAVMVHGVCKGWCVSVCDGLGSRTLSHKGSRRCAQLVRSVIRGKSVASDISPLAVSKQIQGGWLGAFGEDYSRYETTCLWAWVDAKGRAQAAQVGDGLVMVRSRGEFTVLTPKREGFGNQTLTLAQAKDSDWLFAMFDLTAPGDGVLLMTDGIADDLIPEQFEGFFDAVFQRLRRSNKRRSKCWLSRELREWSTPKHGDDKSIAGIFRVE
jgi:hypothetical protein